MKSTEYQFVTKWEMPATPTEVYEIITDSQKLTTWWPAVYLDLKVLEKGEANGLNKLVELYTKGWLPYTLRWKFRVIDANKPNSVEIEAIGDFDGGGKWTFEPSEIGCLVTYDWKIEAKKPFLKKLSWLFKPIFEANHLWAMRKGEESLRLEIMRRKGEKNVKRAPRPTFPHNMTNNKIL
jgi:Polyketide cyclase / dehydrase and lipid transport